MSLGRRLTKGALQIIGAQILQQAVLLLRNVLVGRILAPDQFGLALTFLTVFSAIDAFTELGVELYLVRSREIEDDKLQQTLNSVLVVRGFAIGLLMFSLAAPIAELFHAPGAAWAYQLLAIAPVIRGFMHLDLKRYERDLRFAPLAFNNLASACLGAIATIALALTLHSFVAVVIGMILQIAGQVAGSHLRATRHYRLALVPQHLRNLLHFGVPLIFNGVALFIVAQGDRLLVGSRLGLTQLANYGTVILLSSGAILVLTTLINSLFIPLFAASDVKSATFSQRYDFCGATSTVLAACTMIGFSVLGQSVVLLLFSGKYSVSAYLVTFVGSQAAFRIFRAWQQASLLNSAQTLRAMMTNLISAIGLGGAVAAVFMGHGVDAVAMCLAAAESMSAGVSILLDQAASPPSRRRAFICWGFLNALAVAFFAAHFWDLTSDGLVAQFIVALVAAIMALGITSRVFFSAVELRSLIARQPLFGGSASDTR